jgi:hypothetical protein
MRPPYHDRPFVRGIQIPGRLASQLGCVIVMTRGSSRFWGRTVNPGQNLSPSQGCGDLKFGVDVALNSQFGLE